MKLAEIEALAEGLAPVIRALMADAVKPLTDQIAEMERQLEEARAVDHSEAITIAVKAAVEALPMPKDGAPGRDGVDGKDGRDGLDGKDGAPGAKGEKGDPGEPGKDGVDGAPGERGADGAPGKDGRDGTDGINGKDGEPGKDGAPGKLAIVKEWSAGVTYEAEVRSHNGSTYQALRDTGTEPGGEDWICIAAGGQNGKDADEIEVRGTWDASSVYRRLNIVALNGAAFMARKDDPGPCPGEGWQVIAMRGKPGQQGERGMKGDRGEQGPAGPAVLHMEADDNGLIHLVNGDGSTVDLDLYPVLSKIAG